jgi:hypothetical protein
MSQRSDKIYIRTQKIEFKAAPRLFPRNSGFKGIPYSRGQRKQVTVMRLSRILMGWYWIPTLLLQT